MKVWSFLGSRKHFVGSAMMLVGLFLALIDPVGPQALVLVGAFYLAGVLVTPGQAGIGRSGFEPEMVERKLAATLSAVGGRVPPEVMIRLRRIELLIRSEILPHLDRLSLGSADLYLVKSTGCEYLPAALDAYLRLPQGYVCGQPGSAGCSALSVLLEELEMMENGMRSIATRLHREDMDRLLAHRRFLLERFQGGATRL